MIIPRRARLESVSSVVATIPRELWVALLSSLPSPPARSVSKLLAATIGFSGQPRQNLNAIAEMRLKK